MWFGIVSLFPEMFQSLTEQGVTGRAFTEGKATITFWNPRDYTLDVHRTVDDRPYGGGPGMVMKAQPLADAIDGAQAACLEATGQKAKVVYLSPQGQPVNQTMIEAAVSTDQLIFVCGRYEGVDERLIEAKVDEQWSIGDFILSGGELPTMCVLDAILRQVPGVLGHTESAQQDSFSNHLLEGPQYTRPETWQGLEVPEVLLSGNHNNINQWREEQAISRTQERRPDLFEQFKQNTE